MEYTASRLPCFEFRGIIATMIKRIYLLGVAALLSMSPVSADAAVYVDFVTDEGIFTVELDILNAPLASAHFLALADGSQTWRDPVSGAVRGGEPGDAFYDGMRFYSSLGPFALLGGLRSYPGSGGTNEFWEGPGYTILDDWTNGTALARGDLAMAIFDGPHSGGAEFAVILTNTMANTGHQWTRFGSVTGAVMTVVDDIVQEVAQGSGRVKAEIVIRDEDITSAEIAALEAAGEVLPVVEEMDLALSLSNAVPRISFWSAPHSQACLSVTTNLLAAAWSVLPGDWNKETSAVWRTVSTTSIPGLGAQAGFIYGSQSTYPGMTTRTLPDLMRIDVAHTGADLQLWLDFPAGTGTWVYVVGGNPQFSDKLTNLGQWTATANSVAVDFIVQDGPDIYRDIYWFGLDEEGAMTGRFYYETWWNNALLDSRDWGLFSFQEGWGDP